MCDPKIRLRREIHWRYEYGCDGWGERASVGCDQIGWFDSGTLAESVERVTPALGWGLIISGGRLEIVMPELFAGSAQIRLVD